MKGFFFLITFTAVGAHAQSDWTHFSTTDQGKTKSYIDYSKIKRDSYGANTYTAWWRAVATPPQTVGGKRFSYSLALYRVDCDKATLAEQAIYYYTVAGKLVSKDDRPLQATVAVPESTGETFVNAICSAAKIRGI